jgi:[ribosomal protein S5]-alanine N-acetyltransferase
MNNINSYPGLKTERLNLRGFRSSDATRVSRLAGEFEIADTTLRIPHPYEKKIAEQWISGHRRKYEEGESIHWAIILNENKKLIGSISLMHINRKHLHAEMGYWIGKEYWNYGYASEAGLAVIRYGIEDLGLNRIHAHCFSRNQASARVLKKMGMSHEGTLRQHIRKWHKFEDIEMFAILKSEVNLDEDDKTNRLFPI